MPIIAPKKRMCIWSRGRRKERGKEERLKREYVPVFWKDIVRFNDSLRATSSRIASH